MSSLRVGVVGAGFIGRSHVAAYAATPGVELVAIADPVEAKARGLATRHGAEVVGSLPDLLDLGVDAVSICTPTPTHLAIALTALGAGVHVLCEKPVTLTIDEANVLVEAVDRSTAIFMVGHVSRFEPEHARAQQLVAAGRIGDVLVSSQSITATAPGWSEGNWLFDPSSSGGPILDLAIHSFDYLIWLHQSAPVRVTALAVDTAAGPSTYAQITILFANGSLATVETSWAHPAAAGFSVITEVAGSSGRIDWTYDGISPGRLVDRDGTSSSFDPLGQRGFRSEIASFVDSVRRGVPPAVDIRDARTALVVARAALDSVRLGEPVDCTEVLG
ncbi:MAG: Gfo/Idh/MocA family oxidoreductase [Ilumatobacteraceae bacterium]